LVNDIPAGDGKIATFFTATLETTAAKKRSPSSFFLAVFLLEKTKIQDCGGGGQGERKG
jgi:hypothetical protein